MTADKTESAKVAVLYVDDEEQALKYFRRGMEKEFRILTATNVQQAMTLLNDQHQSIGVVLTDQRMPGRSGVEMLTEIRAKWPAIVRILSTAYTDLDSAVAAVNSGAVYKYITKPVELTCLRQILTEAIAMHRETLHRDALAQTLRELEAQRKATEEAEAAKDQLHHRLVAASRQAGRAEVATGILHNVGNVLNSMNVSASVINSTLQESRIENLLKSLEMIDQHSADLANFISADERGQRLPGYLLKLGPVLKKEQDSIAEAMVVLNRSIDHIMHVIGVQQTHAREPVLNEPVKPAQVMEDAIHFNQSAIEQNHVELLRKYADMPPVLLDQHRVLQILINLISNAVSALGGIEGIQRQLTLEVSATTGDANARICFRIADNGVGIAPENLTKIFTYGFTTRKDGHGFGLHSAANAAKEMGGSLIASSEGAGKGAAFTLELPLQRDEAQAAASKSNLTLSGIPSGGKADL